jgi:hypothetical protein
MAPFMIWSKLVSLQDMLGITVERAQVCEAQHVWSVFETSAPSTPSFLAGSNLIAAKKHG